MSLQQILARAEQRVSAIDSELACLKSRHDDLSSERNGIADFIRGATKLAPYIEGLFADEAAKAPEVHEAHQDQPAETETEPAPVAPAKADDGPAVHAQRPKPVSPPTDREVEERILACIREHRDEGGVCTMSVASMARTIGSSPLPVTNALNRMMTRKTIKRVSEKGKTWAHVIVGEGAPSKPSVAPPAPASEARPVAVKAPGEFVSQILDLVTRAAESDGRALFETARLAKRFETTELRINAAFADLAERGLIARAKSSPKGHVSVGMMPKAKSRKAVAA